MLLPVYGIASHRFEQKDRCIRPKMELAWIKPMDAVTVTLDGRQFQMEALAVVDRVPAVKNAEVLGTFADGSPAVIRKRHGKGVAYLVNTLPGLAYTKAGIPALPYDRNEFANFLPRDYSADARALISAALTQAGVVKRVECSEPLVEGDLLESRQGVVISLANFSGRPIADLRVTVRPNRAVSKVWSVQRGTLEHRAVEGGVQVQMPVGVADFVVVE